MKHNGELTDEFLIAELQKRLDAKNKFLQSQAVLIEEMKELNIRLRDAERVKSNFLSNIRNEINNPLTSIIGLAQQLISGKGVDDEKIKRIAFLINKEAFCLDFQLRNIFAAAEIEAGEVHPKPILVDVTDVIQDQIYYFAEKATQRKVEMLYSNTRPEDSYVTDSYMLQCIIMNLVANAIEFSNPGGVVDIKAGIENGWLWVEVKDFGKGINENDYKHIFDRFRQAEFGTAKKHQGHGLGLSIVKEFVDSMHGKLDIKSEIGKGTLVRISLPPVSESQVPEGFSSGSGILFDNEEVL